MKLPPFLLILAICLLLACARQADTAHSAEVLTAQSIIDQSIEAHGGSAYPTAHIQYTFRDRQYVLTRNGGQFQYERIFEQEGDKIRDILNNDGFIREINGQKTQIPDTMAAKYSNSVNSVHYFAQLPYGLNDPAVNKQYLGISQIKGIPYHKIQVSFQQEGGGKDYEDVFVYWIHTESFHMDYLAYSYETEGGGLRFRESYNAREVGDIRYQDYVNYKADPAKWEVHELDQAFNEGKLKELSKIELESITALD